MNIDGYYLALSLAACIFLIGLVGMLIRRSLIFMLIATEIMLNAAGFAFVIAGAYWQQPDGQVMFIFLLALAASETAIGLALILAIAKHNKESIVDVAKVDKVSSQQVSEMHL